MPVVDGDWREDFTLAGQTREVHGRELVYAAQITGFTVNIQVLVAGKWHAFDTLSGNTQPKEKVFAEPRSFRAVVTGAGTATIVLSPSRPLPPE